MPRPRTPAQSRLFAGSAAVPQVSVTPETSTTEKVASRVRTGAPSRATAALRRLAIGALRLAGRTDIAGGLRYRAPNPAYLLTTLDIT